MSPRRVTAWVLTCLAVGGCTTGQQRREIEAVSDCRRLVAAPAPAPQTATQTATPDRSRTGSTLLGGGGRFQLLDTTLDDGRLRQGGEPLATPLELPLDPDDPRTRAYFAEIKRRVEAFWVYPQEAVRQKQAGSGVVVVMLKRDGRIGEINIVRSTGSDILDRYVEHAIRLASPFPSIPCKVTEEAVPLTLNFRYSLGGVKDASPTQ